MSHKRGYVHRTTFTVEERAAIGEIWRVVELLHKSLSAIPDEKLQTIAALLCERAANIIRGESGPDVWPDARVVEFADAWNIKVRASFNPKPGRRRRG